jgi:phage shock protein E
MSTFAWVGGARRRTWLRSVPVGSVALLLSVCAWADGLRPDAAQVRGAYDSGATFVDVRTDAEWSAGHLERAVHLPVADVDAGAAVALPKKDQPIVLYCVSGRRAEAAAESLWRQGYTHVTAMIGGYADLKAAGFPVAGGPAQ